MKDKIDREIEKLEKEEKELNKKLRKKARLKEEIKKKSKELHNYSKKSSITVRLNPIQAGQLKIECDRYNLSQSDYIKSQLFNNNKIKDLKDKELIGDREK